MEIQAQPSRWPQYSLDRVVKIRMYRSSVVSRMKIEPELCRQDPQ